jgi:hypothetical protein
MRAFFYGLCWYSFAPSKSRPRKGRGGDTLLDILWQRGDGELMIFDIDGAQLQAWRMSAKAAPDGIFSRRL